MKFSAYFRLMRFHKPVGILLLWAPTAWALWISNQGHPPTRLVLIFLLGTILMRAAGCIVNDMTDRDIDKHIKRTKLRPLTTGELGLAKAGILLGILLLGAILLLIQLPKVCFYYAVLAMLMTVFYPFCKRFFNAPQLILGLAFSMAIPMAYSGSSVSSTNIMLLLMVMNTLWVISYDTMYAMVDREDDLRIGVKSTAVLFASYDRMMVLIIQLTLHLLWLCLGLVLHNSTSFYVAWVVGMLVLAQQQRLIHSREAKDCFKAFSLNVWYGLIMWAGLF